MNPEFLNFYTLPNLHSLRQLFTLLRHKYSAINSSYFLFLCKAMLSEHCFRSVAKLVRSVVKGAVRHCEPLLARKFLPKKLVFWFISWCAV